MRSLVMHVDGPGSSGLWRSAGAVARFTIILRPARSALGVNCKNCKRPMELAGAVIAAGSSERARPTPGEVYPKPDGHGLGSERAE